MQKTTVKFFYIPAHIGIEGNEEVDRLAKAATNSNVCEISELPFTDFTQYFKENALARTLTEAKD